jgi:hypothetical protein
MSVIWATLMLTSFTADLAESEDQPTNLQQTLGDLDQLGSGWIYGDLDQAKSKAKELNVPIFALFR